jgi:hypothetical protein
MEGRGAHPRSEGEFEIVGAEGVVFDGDADYFVEESRFAEEVFRHTEPEAE